MLEFISEDIIPIVCIIYALRGAWLNIRNMRIISNSVHRKIVTLSTVVLLAYAVLFAMILLGADHVIPVTSEGTFGSTWIRPITGASIVLLYLMAENRSKESRNDNTNANTRS